MTATAFTVARRRTAPATGRGESTRRVIVDAAIDVILKVGYAHARIPDIARRANVGYGTFYLYFESKLDLARTVMEDVWLEVRRGALLRDRTVPWPDRIRLGVEHTLEAHERHARTFRALWGAAGLAPDLAATRERLLQEDVTILAARIEDERKNGHCREGDALLTSLTVNSMCDEVCRRWVLMGCRPARAAVEAELTRACNLILLGHP